MLGAIVLLPFIASAAKDTLHNSSAAGAIPVSAGWIPIRGVAPVDEPKVNTVPVNIFYRVQILALKHPIDAATVKVDGVEGKLYTSKNNDITRYYMGEFKDLKAANDFKEQLIKNGFEDACIVAYKNGDRITIKESLSILGEDK